MDKKKSAAAVAGVVTGFAVARAIDLALVAGSLATAASAVAFAGYMTMNGTREPLINGMEHLAIFAQPSHRPNHPEDAALDMRPTGALPREKDNVAGYALVGAQERFAWLREGNRIFAVRPGDDVPRLGRIAAIRRHEGRWALVDERGGALIVSALVDLAPSGSGRFDRRMIFGAEK